MAWFGAAVDGSRAVTAPLCPGGAFGAAAPSCPRPAFGAAAPSCLGEGLHAGHHRAGESSFLEGLEAGSPKKRPKNLDNGILLRRQTVTPRPLSRFISRFFASEASAGGESHRVGGGAFADARHGASSHRVDEGAPTARHGASSHHDSEAHHHHTHAVGSHHAGGHHLLTVEGLTVAFDMYDPSAPFFRAGRVRSEVLHGLTLSVHAGEILAVVGASGSGKTVLADALMGMFEPNSEVRGRIWFDGAPQDAASLKALRGRGISLVPQSVNNLDPLMRVGEQVRGVARGATRAEREADARRRTARQRELFSAYGLGPEVERLYPHQLSGGMARRVLLMCALMDEPRLIIADEPTPGLDLDLAVHALDDLRAFANAGGGVLLITHDIELALRACDRVAVFRDGTVVEETARESFASPELLRHPFSRELWHALPGHDFTTGEGDVEVPGSPRAPEASKVPETPEAPKAPKVPEAPKTSEAFREENASGAPGVGVATSPGANGAAGANAALEARGLAFAYPCGRPLFQGLDLTVRPGERVALEAPSGTGKTTLCRLLSGYLEPTAGLVRIDGAPLAPVARLDGAASPVQLLWQHPEQAFDPRMRMGESLAEVAVDRGVLESLRQAFGVREEWLSRLPHELSGGELMRFVMVRALVTRPRYLIADEATAMLDAVTQAELWHVMLDLQERDGWGLVLVSHSPDLVRRIATRSVRLG